MTELDLGPNGALLYCMEYLVRAHARCSVAPASQLTGPAQEDHMDEWLEDILSGFGEDDYVLFDCPGQARAPCVHRAGAGALTPVWLHRKVELYSHVSVFRSFVSQLRQWGWK